MKPEDSGPRLPRLLVRNIFAMLLWKRSSFLSESRDRPIRAQALLQALSIAHLILEGRLRILSRMRNIAVSMRHWWKPIGPVNFSSSNGIKILWNWIHISLKETSDVIPVEYVHELNLMGEEARGPGENVWVRWRSVGTQKLKNKNDSRGCRGVIYDRDASLSFSELFWYFLIYLSRFAWIFSCDNGS